MQTYIYIYIYINFLELIVIQWYFEFYVLKTKNIDCIFYTF